MHKPTSFSKKFHFLNLFLAGHEITYIDEHDGSHIGEHNHNGQIIPINGGDRLIQVQTSQPQMVNQIQVSKNSNLVNQNRRIIAPAEQGVIQNSGKVQKLKKIVFLDENQSKSGTQLTT